MEIYRNNVYAFSWKKVKYKAEVDYDKLRCKLSALEKF